MRRVPSHTCSKDGACRYRHKTAPTLLSLLRTINVLASWVRSGTEGPAAGMTPQRTGGCWSTGHLRL